MEREGWMLKSLRVLWFPWLRVLWFPWLCILLQQKFTDLRLLFCFPGHKERLRKTQNLVTNLRIIRARCTINIIKSLKFKIITGWVEKALRRASFQIFENMNGGHPMLLMRILKKLSKFLGGLSHI